jgi:predicted enzyme related to lactoylglutathione lyase
MSSNISFFAIHADDVARARRFYEQAFGWKFRPWGPPDFFKVDTGTSDDPGIDGAIQKRHELAPGKPMWGFECTIGVPDIEATFAAVKAAGGTIIMPVVEIPGMLRLFKFLDPEGNVVCAGQYLEGHTR